MYKWFPSGSNSAFITAEESSATGMKQQENKTGIKTFPFVASATETAAAAAFVILVLFQQLKRHIQPQTAPTKSQDPFSEPDPIKPWHGPVPASLLIVSPFGLLPQRFGSTVCFLHQRVRWKSQE